MFYVKTESFHTENPVYQKIPGGDGTFFFGESRVAKDYATSGLYERSIIDWASAVFPREDKACIDVGAHMGMYTVELAKKAKHVYGFECSPRSFNYYCANLALRDLNYNVTKYNVALGVFCVGSPGYHIVLIQNKTLCIQCAIPVCGCGR